MRGETVFLSQMKGDAVVEHNIDLLIQSGDVVGQHVLPFDGEEVVIWKA